MNGNGSRQIPAPLRRSRGCSDEPTINRYEGTQAEFQLSMVSPHTAHSKLAIWRDLAIDSVRRYTAPHLHDRWPLSDMSLLCPGGRRFSTRLFLRTEGKGTCGHQPARPQVARCPTRKWHGFRLRLAQLGRLRHETLAAPLAAPKVANLPTTLQHGGFGSYHFIGAY
jgi:hypothetical protein